jgi:hypothetical protein
MIDLNTSSAPGGLFTSREQAESWVLELVVGVREARARADLTPNAVEQRRLYDRLLVRYGAAKGALDALYRCEKVSTAFYETCCAEALAALALKITPTKEPSP